MRSKECSIQDLFKSIKKLSTQEQIELSNLLRIKEKREGILIPISIFKNTKLSALELITRYVHEIKKKTFSEIAKLTNRKTNTIWTTYNNAIKKSLGKLDLSEQNTKIPLEIISNRKFSVLESVVVYLKEYYNFSFQKISQLLNRNYQTIRTVCTRYHLKLKNKEKEKK